MHANMLAPRDACKHVCRLRKLAGDQVTWQTSGLSAVILELQTLAPCLTDRQLHHFRLQPQDVPLPSLPITTSTSTTTLGHKMPFCNHKYAVCLC